MQGAEEPVLNTPVLAVMGLLLGTGRFLHGAAWLGQWEAV